jgi:hypothetical protein
MKGGFYSPIQAYRNPFDHEGPLLFSPPHPGFSASANIALSGLKIPCGRCIGCRLEYSRQWAMRIPCFEYSARALARAFKRDIR